MTNVIIYEFGQFLHIVSRKEKLNKKPNHNTPSAVFNKTLYTHTYTQIHTHEGVFEKKDQILKI